MGNIKTYQNLDHTIKKLNEEVILGAVDILEGNPLMTLQQVNFALGAVLPKKNVLPNMHFQKH